MSGAVSQWIFLIQQLSFQKYHFVLPPFEFSILKSCFSSKTNLSWSQVVLFLFMKDLLKYR